MRRSCRASLVACAGAIVAGAVTVAGCTFLIDFQKVDPPADDGETGAVTIRAPDVGTTAATPPDAARDTDAGNPEVVDAAIANPDACAGHPDGKYCGGNQITWPAERRDDLIRCEAGAIAVVQTCTTGQGCFAMVDGYPDECDECVKKTDGVFCGRDMPGWSPANANQRVQCQGGRVAGAAPCATTCISNGTTSACK